MVDYENIVTALNKKWIIVINQKKNVAIYCTNSGLYDKLYTLKKLDIKRDQCKSSNFV